MLGWLLLAPVVREETGSETGGVVELGRLGHGERAKGDGSL
jgi:hypothetical protein